MLGDGADLNSALHAANLTPEQAEIYEGALNNSKNGSALTPTEALGLEQNVEVAQSANQAIQDQIDQRLATDPNSNVSDLRQQQSALTRLRLSEDTYFDKPTALLDGTGFSRETAEQLDALSPGLADKLNTESGYFGAVYRDTDTNTVVLSNRGTELGFSSDRLGNTFKDLFTDVDLETGLPAQQETDALEAARQLRDSVGDSGSLEFTGHSLGGHLATIQAFAYGTSATVFNPAGLNDQTVARYGLDLDNSNKVTRYVIPGELADNLQGSHFIDALSATLLTVPVNAVGAAKNLFGYDTAPLHFGFTTIPEAVGQAIYLPTPTGVSGLLSLHYTDALFKAFAQQAQTGK